MCLCNFNYIMPKNSALIWIGVSPPANRIIMVVSSGSVCGKDGNLWLVEGCSAAHQGLPISVDHLHFCCLRLTWSRPSHPRFVKDGKLPCAAFKSTVMIVSFSGCNAFFLGLKCLYWNSNNDNNMNDDSSYYWVPTAGYSSSPLSTVLNATVSVTCRQP